MQRDPAAGLAVMLVRALRRRCPRCGGGRVFRAWGELDEWCSTCGLGFEREPGYWVGAMIVDTTATFAALLAALLGGLAATWPEVPWTAVTVAAIAAGGLTPILFYPRAKLVWMAIEMSYHPLEEDERTEAAARLAGER